MFSRFRRTEPIVEKSKPFLHKDMTDLSVLASGQGLTPMQESRKRLMEAWKRDPGQPGNNATIPDAPDLLKTSKAHSHSHAFSRARPDQLGFKPPKR